MLSIRYHITIVALLLFGATVSYAQLSSQDSIRLDRLLKNDQPLKLNRDVIKSIRFGEYKLDYPSEQLPDSSFLSKFDSSLPEVPIEKKAGLTLRPYTIHTRYDEEPIQGLPPVIKMNTDIGPGGGIVGSGGFGVIVVFDAESTLRQIFWKSERAKRRNAKRVQAHKYY